MTNFIQEMRDTPIDIREYYRIVLRRKWLVVFLLAVSMIVSLIRTYSQQKLYTSEAQIQIDLGSLRIVDDLRPRSYGSPDAFYYNTQYRLLHSRSLFEAIAEEYKSTPKSQFSKLSGPALNLEASSIAGFCSVSPMENTQLVNISYTSPDPHLSAYLANTHASKFIEDNIRKRYETTAAASDFISEQIRTLQEQIEIDEKLLQEYARDQEIIKAPKQENITIAKLQKLDEILTDAETSRIARESRYHQVRNASPDTLEEVQANGTIQSLKIELADLEKKYQNMTQRFKPDWPELERVKREYEQARERLDLEITKVAEAVVNAARLEYETALEHETTLHKRVVEQREFAQNLEGTYISYNSLLMKIDNKKKILAELLIKESETEVSARLKGLKTSNIWIVERAEPSMAASSPRHRRNLMIGFLIGLVLSFAVTFFLEYLDNTVNSSEVVERYLQLPFLGFIPAHEPVNVIANTSKLLSGKISKIKSAKGRATSNGHNLDLISFYDPKSILAEAYKNLRTSLLLSSDNLNPRTILVTSSQPQEGKTTTVINLGITLTQLNKKVVLIDADMRNPRLHKVFGLDNEFGLSNFLDNALDPQFLIKKCEVPNLGVITSGSRPKNPSELLSSPRMMKMLEKLTADFDHVVIDSPPMLAIADALILSKMVESTILIVQGEVTSRDTVSKARDRLLAIKAKIHGVVINNVNTTRNSYYYYYYYPYQYKSQDKEKNPDHARLLDA